jgi:hypothetical protein
MVMYGHFMLFLVIIGYFTVGFCDYYKLFFIILSYFILG